MVSHKRRAALRAIAAAGLAPAFSTMIIRGAEAANPITIGFSTSLTGGLASSGKAHLLAEQIWVERINAKGGLLGRPVKLVYYDDQSSVTTVPGIYAKLLDIDKVDLVMGSATNLIGAAMPQVMDHGKLIMVLLALGANIEFKYPRYFQTAPFGPDPRSVLSHAFFSVAKTMTPAPKTVALVGADAEFANNAILGARANSKAFGLEIVYDNVYPPATTDFMPVVRAIQAKQPEIVFVGAYPPDSVGLVRAAHEIGLKTRLFGGAMAGPQFAGIITQLGEELNRLVNFHFFVPSATMKYPGIDDFLKTYQARAKGAGVDPLGFYQPPFAYAAMQIFEQAVTATKSLNDDVLAKYMHATPFETIVGEIKFGELGEWATARILMVQFQNVHGSDVAQFMNSDRQVILYPPQLKDGTIEVPFAS